VKNNLQIVSSLLNLQSNYIRDNKSLEVFKESQNRIKSMALIHEKLYQSAGLTNISMDDYIKELAVKLFDTYRYEAKKIKLKLNIEGIFLDIDKGTAVGLILNELITNTIQHAFNEKNSGELEISFVQRKNDQLIILEDNGSGLPESLDFKKSDTLGFQLIISLVEQLNAAIEYEGHKGSKFTIKIPIKSL
jgi:two-component sensor histidine kinase